MVKPESYVGLSCVAFQRQDGGPAGRSPPAERAAEPHPDQQLRLRCTTGRPNVSLTSFHIKVRVPWGPGRGGSLMRGRPVLTGARAPRRTASPWPPSSCLPASSPAPSLQPRRPTASCSCWSSATGSSSAALATPRAWRTTASAAAWPRRSSTPGRVRAARWGAAGGWGWGLPGCFPRCSCRAEPSRGGGRAPGGVLPGRW